MIMPVPTSRPSIVTHAEKPPASAFLLCKPVTIQADIYGPVGQLTLPFHAYGHVFEGIFDTGDEAGLVYPLEDEASLLPHMQAEGSERLVVANGQTVRVQYALSTFRIGPFLIPDTPTVFMPGWSGPPLLGLQTIENDDISFSVPSSNMYVVLTRGDECPGMPKF